MLAGHNSTKAQPAVQSNAPTAPLSLIDNSGGDRSNKSGQSMESASVTTQPASQLAATPGSASVPASPHTAGSQSSPSARQPYVSPRSPPHRPLQRAGAPVAAPSGPPPEQVRQTRDRLMNLSSRAEAAQTGVQSIRAQQQAQGLDIRGDVLASMSRMNADLSEAQRAPRPERPLGSERLHRPRRQGSLKAGSIPGQMRQGTRSGGGQKTFRAPSSRLFSVARVG